MRVTKVKKVNREEGIKYLIPVIKEVQRLNLPYEIKEKEVIIKIPILIPFE